MSLYIEQLKALFVKDWLVRRRHWFATLYELFMPLAGLMFILNSSLQANSPESPTPSFQPSPFPLPGSRYFSCDSLFHHIYVAPSTADVELLLKTSELGCEFRYYLFPNESSIFQRFTTDARYNQRGSPTTEGLTFQLLDLDQRIANYTVLIHGLENPGPWLPDRRMNDQERFALQTVINLLLLHYPYRPVLTSIDYTPNILPASLNDNSTTERTSEGSIDLITFHLIFLFLELVFLNNSSIMIRRIVTEKSTTSKEFLRIMGMSDKVYWISTFINYYSISIFHATYITVILHRSYANVFGDWSPTAFFVSYLLTNISVILTSFALSTIINNPIIAELAVVGVRPLLGYAAYRSSLSKSSFLWISTKAWSCLIPDGGIYWSVYDVSFLGKSGESAWMNLFSPVKDSIPLGVVFIITIFSYSIWAFLTYYLDAVCPWQPGIPKPWYFLCRRCYPKTSDESQVIDLEARDNSGLHESNVLNSEASIRCINLKRSFGSLGSKRNAVDGLNLDIMKGQITVLLGHNGAGKTTTMNMITGILPPSSGSVLVKGIDVGRNVDAARQVLALCPQTSIVFEELTVRENLYLCAGLRGLSSAVKRELVPLNISRVHLGDKANTLASKLSGGMRRRLQLALALTTSSEILILDEPTSGLDPESRRQLWNLLIELRKNLTILLTTHFMEEADALGDRIVIMDSGRIKCSGSPMFLKNKLGAGFLMRIAKNPTIFKADETSSLIQSYFSRSQTISDTNEEIIYRLDHNDSNSISSAKLPELCDKIDERKGSLGIVSYGISVSTLEDVFLRVAMQEGESGQLNKQNVSASDSLFNMDQVLNYQTLTGFSLAFQRLKGLVFKRFHYAKRHKKILIYTFLIPVFVYYFSFSSAFGATLMFDYDSNFDPIEINAKKLYGNVSSVILTQVPINLILILPEYINHNKEMGIETEIFQSTSEMETYLTQHNLTPKTFLRKFVYGLIVDNPNSVQLWYNPEATYGLELSIDAYTNALTRLRSPQSKSRFVTYYKSGLKKVTPIITKVITVISMMTIFAPFGISLISGSYFLFPSTENNVKSALIQRISGIGTTLFWTSNYLFDIIYHSLVSIIIFGVICYVDPLILENGKIAVTMLSALLLGGFAVIPIIYLLSYLPVSPDSGFIFIIIGTICCIFPLSIVYYTFKFVTSLIGTFTLSMMASYLFPPYTLNIVLTELYVKVIKLRHCEALGRCKEIYPIAVNFCCNDTEIAIHEDPFDKVDGVSDQMIFLLITPFIYFLLLIAFDMNLQRLGYCYESLVHRFFSVSEKIASKEDDDVAIERERIDLLLKKPNFPDALIVQNLTKEFRKFRAVDHLNFSVRPKECFGLLGVNGAGKTTTFRMLTGDLLVTSGDAYIRKISLRNDLNSFQQLISYCPQYDALLANLNPRETLALFARLRGMPESKVRANVDFMIKSLELMKHAFTLNCNLSGGNKRKLSLAIAAIAKPELMFLDEPTTGVDPASRRKIWSSLIHLRESSGASIILTSHSMDECEALCGRIGIMARGRLRCLGSAQYLKEKFGQGFSLLIKLKHEATQDNTKVDQVNDYIRQNFPSASLRDQHQTIMSYHITDTTSRWGDMLRKMDAAKVQLPIDDYTLTGTTLEQVFLSFARKT